MHCDDPIFMASALQQAERALATGEVPVGAVVVRNGQIIGYGSNSPISSTDPCAHAEIVALRAAAKVRNNYRLDDCELFVTLEPCPMCSGAVLHARIKRLVFGAPDPKTGACGSVVNLFSNAQLNHQTEVVGGVLQEQSRSLLHTFFSQRRAAQRADRSPIREDAVRTPDSRFNDLPGYPWPPHFVSDLPSLQGLRLHYLDEGRRGAARTYLCLHGNLTWSYLYRKMIPVLVAAGNRVVAPDLIGFGKSDKPKKQAFHRFGWHRQVLLELVDRLGLDNIVLVLQGWGARLGLTLPPGQETRYRGLMLMNALLTPCDVALSAGHQKWRTQCANRSHLDLAGLIQRETPGMHDAEAAAYDAPFADAGFFAALHAFLAMEGVGLDGDDALLWRQALVFWRDHWNGKTMTVIGMCDGVLGAPVLPDLQQLIRACPAPWRLEQTGHWVPEHGQAIAEAAVSYFASTVDTIQA